MEQKQRREEGYIRKELESLSASEEYRNFVNSLKSAATKRQYAYCILHYIQYLQLDSPTDLMFQSNFKTIESHLIDYMVYLKSKVQYSTRNVNCSAIITFYAMNDIILNKKKLYRYLGEQTRAHRDRAYTTEEIHRLLEYADARLSAIVLLISSCGLRPGALPDLRIANLKPVPAYDLYQVTSYLNAKEEYYTFCTPEAKNAIDQYLTYRERSGERLTPNSPLFREQFDLNDPFQIANPRHLANRSIEVIFDRALVRAGLREVDHETETKQNKGKARKEVSRFNGFRKFFNTNLVMANVNPQIKEMLMGHSINLDDNYLKPTPDQVLGEYVKAINLLTINEEHRLKMQVKELRLKVDKFDKLEEKMERLSRAMGFDETKDDDEANNDGPSSSQRPGQSG